MVPFNNLDRIQASTGHNQPEHFSKRLMLNVFLEYIDAVPLDNLEDSQYYALLAINTAYNMKAEELIQGYNNVVKNQTEIKMRGGRKTDRSKSIYQSKNSIKKNKSLMGGKKSVYIDLPNVDTILFILRMRKDKQPNYPIPVETIPADKISQDVKEQGVVPDENKLPLR
ncbi:hypothetical protein RO3G_12310 [Rhizopus delemar RA 99-880]|uniref:Uncharacterized protein n=1 Tax=Rhizopus delemar (strain RA 99-880 / ATCC MYA-4621 / FGSC 9543 / NRRL 43880) TaxID=246409 RepID=I1CGL9_RHIO9|nr:hypothetical protein RO3G_12310 [Rhizopus delemar RA 99-880]|eukprot:EIE87599.1 hypothetical protein RO3G_12310 [Rhizopus delemar RA 99-880]